MRLVSTAKQPWLPVFESVRRIANEKSAPCYLPGTALPTHTIDGVLTIQSAECWAWISQPAPVVPMVVSDVTSSQLPRTINISSCSKTSPRAAVAADAAAAGPSISLQAECLCGSGGNIRARNEPSQSCKVLYILKYESGCSPF